MSRCTKAMARPAVYQAMIDCWRGVKTYHQMLGILAQGKSSQAYMHILIFANLPYFTEMSSRWVTVVPIPYLFTTLFYHLELSDTWWEWMVLFAQSWWRLISSLDIMQPLFLSRSVLFYQHRFWAVHNFVGENLRAGEQLYWLYHEGGSVCC